MFPFYTKTKDMTSIFSSVAQSCPTLCDPIDCSTLGFPVNHQLPELAQTQVHWICDDIQTSHPPLSPSPPAFNLSQHQGLFKWVSSLLSLSCVWFFVTPWTAARQASLSISNSWNRLKLVSIVSVMPSNHLIPSNLRSHSKRTLSDALLCWAVGSLVVTYGI